MDAVRSNVRQALVDDGYEDVMLFDCPDYDDAIIGVTLDDRAVYDLNLMAECLVRRYGWTPVDALDWIGYNTLPALPSEGAPPYPVIMRSIHKE